MTCFALGAIPDSDHVQSFSQTVSERHRFTTCSRNNATVEQLGRGEGGGGDTYKKEGDARRKF